MKRLQRKIKILRAKLKEIRTDLFFQSLTKEEKIMFFNSLKLLSEFEDILIIKYILNRK